MSSCQTSLRYCPLLLLIALTLMITGALGYLHQALPSPTLFYAGLALFVTTASVWLLGLLCTRGKQMKRSSLGVLLGLMGVLMFGFTYALIPFYDVLCNQLDINGKVHALPINKGQVQRHKTTLKNATVLNTLITAHGGIPVEISQRALHQSMVPGEPVTPTFTLTNVSDRTLSLRVKMSLSPSRSGHYLVGQNDLNQSIITLKPYAKKRVQAAFFLQKNAPKDLHHVALGIGLFNTKQ